MSRVFQKCVFVPDDDVRNCRIGPVQMVLLRQYRSTTPETSFRISIVVATHGATRKPLIAGVRLRHLHESAAANHNHLKGSSGTWSHI
jgi:hypothetical protein